MSDEKTARDKLVDEVKEESKNPEEVRYFLIVNDRYYYGMWCMPIPEALCQYGAKQGDLVMMAHRKLDTLTEWMVKMRFRYHLGPDPENAYNLTDRKHWKAFVFRGSEVELEAAVAKVFDIAIVGANVIGGGIVHVEPPDFLELKCQGGEVPGKMMAAKKDWLHMKSEEELAKEKYFTRREKAMRQDELADKIDQTKPGSG